MRRTIGPFIIVVMLLFGVDMCANATPEQKDAFSRAVRRTVTYDAVESLVPSSWWDAWTEDWRQRTAPHLPDEDEGDGGD